MKENKDAPMSLLNKLFLFLISVFALTCGAFVWDGIWNNAMIYNKYVYGSDCNFKTPEGYTIYYSEDKKLYAVKVNQFGDSYLYNGKHGITPMFSSIAEPSLFIDSCRAKGYLKAYIEQSNPKFK